jgi:hypothetical protein
MIDRVVAPQRVHTFDVADDLSWARATQGRDSRVRISIGYMNSDSGIRSDWCMSCRLSTRGCFAGSAHGYMCCNNNNTNNNKLKGVRVIGAGGLVVSVIAFAVGAILDWAVTEPYQHGFNINKAGWILMLVGAIGAVLSIIVMVAGNTRRRQTVVDDGQGNVVRRVDSTY